MADRHTKCSSTSRHLNRTPFVAALTAALLLVMTATAYAADDQLTADGDTLTSGPNVAVTNCSVAHTYVGSAVIHHSNSAGGQHFANGALVTVTAAPDAAGIAAGITTTGGSVTLPNPWTSSSPDKTANIGLSIPAGITTGSYKVTVTASGTGASITDQYVVNVTCPTNTAPTLTLPGAITAEATSGSGRAVTYTATASDTQDGTLTPTCSPASGSTFPLGTTAVDCSVTDSGGLTTTGSFNVIIRDTTAPVLALPSDITQEATGPNGAIVTFSASASDVVDGSIPPSCDAKPGDQFPLGTTTVHCSATDAHNNTASGSFKITVQDTTPPDVSVPIVLPVEATSASGAAVTFVVSANDLVDGSITPVCDLNSGDTFPLGETTVHCHATDDHDNVGSGSFKVTVVDTTKPTVHVPTDITAEATGPGGAAVGFTVTATDQVDGSLPATCDAASGTTFPIGQTTVTCSATDAHNNTGVGSFKITVQDTTAPDVTVPPDKTVEATGPNGASVTFNATASDIVDGAVATTCSPSSGSTFPLGETTVDCSATDAHDNTGHGSFKVTVRDTTPPKIDVPGDETVEATGPDGAHVMFDVTATDLVDGSVTPNCDFTSGDLFAFGDTKVTCDATDTHSNKASASFVITVADTTPPDVHVPGDITAEATGPSGAAVNFVVTATDLVDGSDTATCSPTSGTTFSLGDTTVQCEATDAHSNTGTGSFEVSVVDTTPPIVTVPGDKTVEATGPGGAPVTFSASASDLVDGSVATTCSPASGSTFPLGTTTVLCSATDAHTNTGSASFKITVVDTTPPTIDPHADITVGTINPSGVVVTYTSPATHDLVDGDGVATCSLPSGSMFAVGTTTVTCNASDAHGNAATSTTFNVNVDLYSASFKAPIDGPSVINVAKSGRVIPVKVEVFKNSVENKTGPVFIQVKKLSTCTLGTTTDDVEAYAAGSSNTGVQFRWDATSDAWIYNLDTSAFSMAAPNCYQGEVYVGGIVDANNHNPTGQLAGYFLIKITK